MSLRFQQILAFILAMGPLVFIHEFGHFIVAKYFKIGVPVFSLGFGPRLFGFRRGETDYRVSAIPLGGYVRLAGDEADENRCGSPEEFLSRPKHQRFFVFVAGATFNIILAFLTFWLLFGVYGKDEVLQPDTYPVVLDMAEDSAAAKAGVLPGDRIIEIANRDIRGFDVWHRVENLEILLAPGTVKPVLVEREGRRLTLSLEVQIEPRLRHGLRPGWYLSWGESETASIERVIAGTPAEEIGLRPGDRIVAAGGLDPISKLELRSMVEASPGKELVLTVERDGGRLEMPVVPRSEEGTGKIGVIFTAAVHRDLGFGEAALESLDATLQSSTMLFVILKRLVTGELSLRSVSGPVGIAEYAQEALSTSLRDFVWLVGFFSLQLGILNLLPIPVLDGGHIFILFVEGLLRRELSDTLKERVMQLGFVFLLTFMGAVIILDFVK